MFMRPKSEDYDINMLGNGDLLDEKNIRLGLLGLKYVGMMRSYLDKYIWLTCRMTYIC